MQTIFDPAARDELMLEHTARAFEVATSGKPTNAVRNVAPDLKVRPTPAIAAYNYLALSVYP